MYAEEKMVLLKKKKRRLVEVSIKTPSIPSTPYVEPPQNITPEPIQPTTKTEPQQQTLNKYTLEKY